MKIEKILLKEHFEGLGESPAVLETYIQPCDNEYKITNRPAMIIFPGGGYHFTSHREAEPVALRFATLGYQCFVLWYTCAPARYPQQLLEGTAAVAYVRQHAEEFNVDPKRISVMGFSAGGHCAGMAGTLWAEPIVAEKLGVEPLAARPDAMVLCYPVISGGEYAHRGSFDNLLGEDPSEALLHKTSLEYAVNETTPPTFLWTSADDNCVPGENTLMMALSLKKHNVPYELHVFGSLPHGASLANEQVYASGVAHAGINPRVAKWPEECDCWLREQYARMQ